MGVVGMTIARFTKRKTQVGRFMAKNPPPRDFRKFAYKYEKMEDLWRDCRRPEWMLWIINCLDFRPADGLRLFACYCARRFAHSMKDPRCVAVIDMAEKFARREADWDEVEAARADAYKVLEEARNRNDVLAENIAWAAASVAKEDPFTAAYDTLVYATKLAELQRKDILLMREMLASKVRDLIGNPFKTEIVKKGTPANAERP